MRDPKTTIRPPMASTARLLKGGEFHEIASEADGVFRMVCRREYRVGSCTKPAYGRVSCTACLRNRAHGFAPAPAADDVTAGPLSGPKVIALMKRAATPSLTRMAFETAGLLEVACG